MTKWYQTDKDDICDLYNAVLDVVCDIPAPGISTTDLMRRMGATKKNMDGLTKALVQLRARHPLFATAIPGQGTFGKNLILWHDPKLATAST